MMSGLLIRGGTIVNEGESYRGWIVVEGERIARTGRGDYPRPEFDGETIDAEGMYVLPGVIDDQVHFREPGLTYKGDLHSESIAAAAGGVTSYMDMPNVKPPTVTNALLEEKLKRAAETSVVNYSFYLGATNDNIEQIRRLDPKRVCGVKLFMGSSTGNMLVDDERALRALFAESPVPIAAHCEDEPTVRADMERFRTLYGESGLTVAMHPLIRSAEADVRRLDMKIPVIIYFFAAFAFLDAHGQQPQQGQRGLLRERERFVRRDTSSCVDFGGDSFQRVGQVEHESGFGTEKRLPG